MNGIEKITGRIASDAQAEVDRILANAGQQAENITGQCAREAQEAREAILAEARAQAAVKAERMESAARLEGRKLLLEEKQRVLEEAFSLALQKLREMDKGDYVRFLTGLLVQSAATGREEVIFNPTDRARVGKEVLTAANEAIPNGSLRLAAESRDIQGGFVLVDGPVEVNCSLEALVAQSRERETGAIAGLLFP